jgi:anti-sigma B factor antagonist
MGELSRLVISARLDSVRQACDSVVEAAELAGLNERAVYHCQMAVDETLTNIIEHGFQFQGDDSEIEIVCQTDLNRFLIVITDDSPAFNPLEHESPDPAEPLDTREPGGWGIYFIRRLMDDVAYQRIDNRNQLTLTKNRPNPSATEPPGDETDESFPVRVLENGAVIISPVGRLDSNTSPRLEKALNTQLGQGHYWLFVDMPGIEYIASSGLKVLVSAWRRAREFGGDLVLSGLQPRIVEIFEMVGFDMLFQIFPDIDSAIAIRPTTD